ncbi:MAG TPA: glucosamine-6-phosphate deaminase [Erysipelotrichaceae bacterium]|nr:glucosamine-6-phosphate deaminase [Erysipelotrichaceae bacterium]
MFEIHVFDTYDQVSEKAFEVMKEVVVSNPQAVLGLATGSSPVGLYKKLVDDFKVNRTSYKTITTYNLDEYVGIPQEHEQSYYTFMFQNFFAHVDIPHENIHMPVGISNDLKAYADAYELELQKHPQDIQLLGIGSNGHIGFNEPGTSFDMGTHIVDLKEQTRIDNARFFASFDDVPTQAMTMGIQDILRAKKILLIATGEKKAKAIAGMIEGPISEAVPCSILQKHPHVVVVLDKEAAKEL